nr:hypothetical protein [Tanacetum cinerariifolium]
EQAQSSRNRLSQLNAMILEMEAMNDPEEFYDVWLLHYDNSGQLANLNLVDLYDGLDLEMHLQFVFVGLAYCCIFKTITWTKHAIRLKYSWTTNQTPHTLQLSQKPTALSFGPSLCHQQAVFDHNKDIPCLLLEMANNPFMSDIQEGFLNIMFDFNMMDDMPIMDEVVFNIHKNGYFEFDLVRYVNGSVSSVYAFTCDRDIFPTCLDWICSKITENKWALFYCLLNKSLEQGLKLIHTDNDVYSLFADAESSGKVHLYIAHKQQNLGRYYLRNMVWVEEDAALRCSSSSPFYTRIKRKFGRKSVKTSRMGKEIMYELPSPSPTKESQVVFTNYKRSIVNGKAKMVDVENVGLVQDKIDVGNKENVGTRRNVLGLLAPVNKHKQPIGLATKVHGSTVKINELPDNYCVLEVNYDGVFNEYPIRCGLEEGLTIVEGAGDMNKLYDIAKNASDEEVKSKLKSHEKRKLDACSMSHHELVEWEQQEASSPYLRTPPLKPRRKGIEFPCKDLFGDFLHCDSIANEVVLHDNWKYKGLALDGYIDVGGSNKHCDLVHENVVDNGRLLPNMDRERFSNNVVLDDVVTDTLAYTLPLEMCHLYPVRWEFRGK